MICPNCKKEMKCPCSNCNNTGTVWKWVTGNGHIECGYCGYSMDMAAFEAEEYRQYLESRTEGL